MTTKPVIGVFGSSKEQNQQQTEFAKEIGQGVAEQYMNLLTGACPGLPMRASEGYQNQANESGQTIGISPFSKGKHLEMGMTTDFLDIVIYTALGDTMPSPDCYAARNPVNVASSDGAIILPGTQGTIDELALSLAAGSVIAVASGIDRDFDEKVDHLLKEQSAQVYRSDSTRNLVDYVRANIE